MIKNWKKFNEHPDFVEYENSVLTFHNGISFTETFDGDVFIGETGDDHAEIVFKHKNVRASAYDLFCGRLWIFKKIISFWSIGEKNSFYKKIQQLNDLLYEEHGVSDFLSLNTWKMELGEEEQELIYVSDFLISDMGFKVDKEKLILHQLDAKRKREELKKMGYKSKTRETSKLPPAAYRDTISKYKFTENNYLQNYDDFILLEKFDLKNLFNKIKISNNKKQIATIIATILLGSFTITQSLGFIEKQNIPEKEIELIKSELFVQSEQEDVKDIHTIEKEISNYNEGDSYRLSQSMWDFIRYEEGCTKNKGEPVLTAYRLNDGMITIGWGHANPVRRSPFKVGDKITREKAQELFVKDMNEAAAGVRRIFKQWRDEGIDVKITQNQYDVLVSLAFNMGVSGLRQTEMIQELKKNNHEKAGEMIKITGLKDGFSGLNSRREQESELFLKN